MSDTVFQGKAIFGTTKPQSFRFEVIASNENRQLVIWLEDRVTKKQWQTAALELQDFVTTANAIPGATILPYAKRFAQCLENSAASPCRALTSEPKDGCRTLRFNVTLEWDAFRTLLSYSFQLKEVPLDRIDLITSQVRDVEEKLASLTLPTEREKSNKADGVQAAIAALEKRVDDLAQTAAQSVFAQAVTETRASHGEPLVWVETPPNSSAFTFFLDGNIRFNVGGTFFVSLSVVHSLFPQGTGKAFELLHRQKVVMTADCVVQQGKSEKDAKVKTATSMHVVLTVDTGDRIFVRNLYNGDCPAGSHLSIFKI